MLVVWFLHMVILNNPQLQRNDVHPKYYVYYVSIEVFILGELYIYYLADTIQRDKLNIIIIIILNLNLQNLTLYLQEVEVQVESIVFLKNLDGMKWYSEYSAQRQRKQNTQKYENGIPEFSNVEWGVSSHNVLLPVSQCHIAVGMHGQMEILDDIWSS